MSTIVQYECRNVDHIQAGSRRGSGGLVIHHGTVGYCDGLHMDPAHHWVATGGVPIENLIESGPEIDPGTYRTEDGELIHVRTSASGAMRISVDGRSGRAGDVRVGVKLSDDPDWPDGSSSQVMLLHAD
jgi:hypothetical protein